MNEKNGLQSLGAMDDKARINDSLRSQRFMTANYNTFAGECASTQLRDDMLSILQDEHMIQSEIFNQMSSRGWYPTKQADQNQVTQVKQMMESGS